MPNDARVVRLAKLRQISGSGAAGSIGVTAFNVIVSLAITVLLARLLGPSEFGTYTFVYVIVLTLSIPLTSGLRTLLVREVATLSDRADWPRLNGLLRTSLFAWVGYCLVLTGVLAVARRIVSSEWAGIAPSLYALGFLLLPSVAAIAGLSAIMTGMHRVVLGQAMNLLFRPFLFVLAIVLVWQVGGLALGANGALRLNVNAALFAAALSLVVTVRLMPKSALSARPEYDLPTWARSVVLLTLNASVGLVYTYTDVLMLGLIDAKESVGHYRVATQGAVFVVLVMQALTALVNPGIARGFSRGDLASLEAVLVRYTVVALVPASVVFLVYLSVGGQLLALTFGPSYAAAWGPLVILGLGQLVNVATGFVGPVLNMTGHERETVVGTTLSALINMILNLVLIPQFGVTGAAIATGISIVFWNVYLCWRAFCVTGLRVAPLWAACARVVGAKTDRRTR